MNVNDILKLAGQLERDTATSDRLTSIEELANQAKVALLHGRYEEVLSLLEDIQIDLNYAVKLTEAGML